MAGLFKLWQLMQLAKRVESIPAEKWRIALSIDLDHLEHLRLSATMPDGKDVTIYRQSVRRMLEDLVVDESDRYCLIIGTEMFDDDPMSQRAIEKIYQKLTKLLHEAINAFVAEKKQERRQQAPTPATE